MTRKKYVPPSKLAARVYKALLLTNFAVIPEATMSNTRLKFDFAVPNLSIVVECDGSQHQTYSGFFHDGKDDFRAAQARDQQKQAYCDENGLTLVRLDEKEIMFCCSPVDLLKKILEKVNQKDETPEEW